MRVLVVSNLYPPDFIGGYELGCRQVVDDLRDRDHEVRVLTSIPRTAVSSVSHVHRRMALNFEHWNLSNTPKSAPLAISLDEAESLFINANNVYALIEQLEEFEPDVVYLWMLTGLGALGLVACLQHLQVPWVWHLMDDVPLAICKRQDQLIDTLAREFHRQMRGSFIACSHGLLDEIKAGGVTLNGEVEIIPNWVADVAASTRSSYLQNGNLQIVSAGQLGSHKGVDLIIKAARLLLDQGYQNFHVDLFGRGDELSLQMMSRQLGVHDHVAFRGVRTQAELMVQYENYDVFAFPTWEREPFAFAPLEAATSGCVPIMSQICGNSEWMVDRVHCLKVPRTAEALAATFRQVLDGGIDLRPIGRRASAMVRRDFHLRTLIPRIERTLARAARTPKTRAGDTAEAYRLALLAEKLTKALIQESFLAA